MGKRILLLGDSITQGLGSKQINFTDRMDELVGPSYLIENWALTGSTIKYPNCMIHDKTLPECDICVILYGNVDAQLRPNSKGRLFKVLPARFQGNGMLSPRPFYSSNPMKMFMQKLENGLRSLFRFVITKIDGVEQWVNITDFDGLYRELVVELQSAGTSVVCCSTVYIDERLFPGSPYQYEQYNNRIRSIAADLKCAYVDLYQVLKENVEKKGWNCSYNKDHFHPNAYGYDLIANVLASRIKAI